MLLVPTRLAPSAIHGLGVFATAEIAAGDAIWRFAPPFDQIIPAALAETFPAAFRDFLVTYAYLAPDFPGCYVLSCDHAKFLNHADEPNTVIDGQVTLARTAIRAGEEITCDYRACVAGWTGFDAGAHP